MNAVLHGWATATIMSGNTFSDPQYFEEGSDETVLRRFDYIVANPPFSIKNWTDGVKNTADLMAMAKDHRKRTVTMPG